MARPKIRYLVAKLQKGGHMLYYWQPAATLRSAGFLPRRIAEATNTLTDAIAEAERLNAQLDAWRAGVQPVPLKPETIPWLVRHYQTDPRYTDLAEKTKQSYDWCMKVLEAWSERAGHPPLRSITRRVVRTFYRSMVDKTPSKANAVMRMLSILMSVAKDEGFVGENPAEKQHLRGTQPRQQVWTMDEVQAFCTRAADVGRGSIALAVLLAYNLGQRETDVLAMPWSKYDGDVIRLRQSKTKVLLDVPVLAELRDALDATEKKSPTMVVSETTGRPYRVHNFTHLFAEIRDAIGLRHLQYRDLRRSAVVALAEAGCEIPEISAITGHSLARCVSILETYLPRNSMMARNAIAKLEEYRKRTKVGSPNGETGSRVGRNGAEAGI